MEGIDSVQEVAFLDRWNLYLDLCILEQIMNESVKLCMRTLQEYKKKCRKVKTEQKTLPKIILMEEVKWLK